MSSNARCWLVEIVTKHANVHVEYREVEAKDEYFARHSAVKAFEFDYQYIPSKRKTLSSQGITVEMCCAGGAVQL